MSNPNESLAEILARIRAETRGEDGVIYVMDGRKVLEYVDRIEAAVKHETGNVAKLRGALENLIKFTCGCCQERHCEEPEEFEDGRGYSLPCNAILEAKHALEAPPRNCDICATVDEAYSAHKAWCEARSGHCDGGRDMSDPACADCFDRWLLDTARPQKGCDHAEA